MEGVHAKVSMNRKAHPIVEGARNSTCNPYDSYDCFSFSSGFFHPFGWFVSAGHGDVVFVGSA